MCINGVSGDHYVSDLVLCVVAHPSLAMTCLDLWRTSIASVLERIGLCLAVQCPLVYVCLLTLA